MSLSKLLHAALYALPDVTLAIDLHSLRILDVNRAAEALGYPKADLAAIPLDKLLDIPRAELARFVTATDGRSIEVRARKPDGSFTLVSVRASTSGAAAASPCVLLVLREIPEHGRLLDEIDRIYGVLDGVVESLGQLSASRRPAAPQAEETEIELEEVTEWIPELSVEQYAALHAEAELHPARTQDINARYGLTTATAREALDKAWSEKFARDPGLRAQWTARSTQYREWFQAQGRARGEVTSPGFRIADPPSEDRSQQRTTAPPLKARPVTGALPFVVADAPAATPAPQLPVPSVILNIRPPDPGPARAPDTQRPQDNRATVAPSDMRTGAMAALPFKPVDGPEFTLEQYAAIAIEIEVHPDRLAQILAKHGIQGEAKWRACEAQWATRLVGDMALRERWMKLSTELRQVLAKR